MPPERWKPFGKAHARNKATPDARWDAFNPPTVGAGDATRTTAEVWNPFNPPGNSAFARPAGEASSWDPFVRPKTHHNYFSHEKVTWRPLKPKTTLFCSTTPQGFHYTQQKRRYSITGLEQPGSIFLITDNQALSYRTPLHQMIQTYNKPNEVIDVYPQIVANANGGICDLKRGCLPSPQSPKHVPEASVEMKQLQWVWNKVNGGKEHKRHAPHSHDNLPKRFRVNNPDELETTPNEAPDFTKTNSRNTAQEKCSTPTTDIPGHRTDDNRETEDTSIYVIKLSRCYAKEDRIATKLDARSSLDDWASIMRVK